MDDKMQEQLFVYIRTGIRIWFAFSTKGHLDTFNIIRGPYTIMNVNISVVAVNLVKQEMYLISGPAAVALIRPKQMISWALYGTCRGPSPLVLKTEAEPQS